MLTQKKPLDYLNVGTGTDITIKDLAIKVSKIIGFKDDTKSGKKTMTDLEDDILAKTEWQIIFNH